VSAGVDHSLAVTDDGRLFTWGRNDCNQLGLNFLSHDVPEPTEVINLSQDFVIAAEAGSHTIAVVADGGVKTFGMNDDGQLGVGHRLAPFGSDSKFPDNIFTPLNMPSGLRPLVAAGASHSLIITGSPLIFGGHAASPCAFSWGYNKHGELGHRFSTPAVDGISVGAKVPAPIVDMDRVRPSCFSAGW
jgi:hypothetical protein